MNVSALENLLIVIYRVQFLFRHPKSVDASNIFLQPFDTLVWICVVIVGILFAYLLRQIFIIENHKTILAQNNGNAENAPLNESAISNSLLIIFGFLFQQGLLHTQGVKKICALKRCKFCRILWKSSFNIRENCQHNNIVLCNIGFSILLIVYCGLAVNGVTKEYQNHSATVGQ